MNKLTPVPAERTMQLCQAVIDYMGIKLREKEIITPSLQTISALAFDIRKELSEKFSKKVNGLNTTQIEKTEQNINKLSPEEIESFIWLELVYSESHNDFFNWLIKNFDINQK